MQLAAVGSWTAGSVFSASERRHLDARVVEARAAAEIGQRVGNERVRRRAVVGALAPEPLGQATVPGRMSWVSATGQCTSPSSLKTRTGSSCGRGRGRAASDGCICSTPARSRSSPSVDETVFSLAGEISASGIRSVAGIGLIAVEPGRRLWSSAAGNRSTLPVRRQREHVDELDRARRRTAASPRRVSISSRRRCRGQLRRRRAAACRFLLRPRRRRAARRAPRTPRGSAALRRPARSPAARAAG